MQKERSTLALPTEAPTFTLEDTEGNPVALSDYRHRSHVVLVFNRGFT